MKQLQYPNGEDLYGNYKALVDDDHAASMEAALLARIELDEIRVAANVHAAVTGDSYEKSFASTVE